MRGKFGRRLARVLACDRARLREGVAAVSITFDDVPATACTTGSELVAEAGGRATYYVSGSFEFSDAPGRFHTAKDLARLNSEGHEIGCHGYGHLNYQSISQREISEDIERNQQHFQSIGLPPAATFAYPYGCVNPEIKMKCSTYYPVCRGITAGLNSGVLDRRLLKAVPFYSGSWSLAQSRRLLEQAVRQGGLAVFFTHGVEPDPGEFDCTPDLLRQTLEIARDLDLQILPLGAAMNRLCLPT